MQVCEHGCWGEGPGSCAGTGKERELFEVQVECLDAAWELPPRMYAFGERGKGQGQKVAGR